MLTELMQAHFHLCITARLSRGLLVLGSKLSSKLSCPVAFQMQNYLSEMRLREQGYFLVPARGGALIVSDTAASPSEVTSAHIRLVSKNPRCRPL